MSAIGCSVDATNVDRLTLLSFDQKERLKHAHLEPAIPKWLQNAETGPQSTCVYREFYTLKYLQNSNTPIIHRNPPGYT